MPFHSSEPSLLPFTLPGSHTLSSMYLPSGFFQGQSIKITHSEIGFHRLDLLLHLRWLVEARLRSSGRFGILTGEGMHSAPGVGCRSLVSDHVDSQH